MQVGSGNRVTQQRNVAPFSAIHLNVAAHGLVKVGGEQNLVIEIDDNLMSYVVTEVSTKMLTISSRDAFYSAGGLRVAAVCANLQQLIVSGAGDLKLENLGGGDCSLLVEGAAKLDGTGAVSAQNIRVNGVGAEIDLFNVVAEFVTVTINGVGNVEVTATRELKAVINGVGKVRYRGNPSRVSKQVNGVGSVMPG